MTKIKNTYPQYGIRLAYNAQNTIQFMFFGWHFIFSCGNNTFVTGKADDVFKFIDSVGR